MLMTSTEYLSAKDRSNEDRTIDKDDSGNQDLAETYSAKANELWKPL